MTDDLPPLPDPYTEQVVEYTGIAVNRVDRFPLYTADQMRAYGDARAAAATNLAVSRCLVAPVKTGRQDQREACANAIRARS